MFAKRRVVQRWLGAVALAQLDAATSDAERFALFLRLPQIAQDKVRRNRDAARAAATKFDMAAAAAAVAAPARTISLNSVDAPAVAATSATSGNYAAPLFLKAPDAQKLPTPSFD